MQREERKQEEELKQHKKEQKREQYRLLQQQRRRAESKSPVKKVSCSGTYTQARGMKSHSFDGTNVEQLVERGSVLTEPLTEQEQEPSQILQGKSPHQFLLTIADQHS